MKSQTLVDVEQKIHVDALRAAPEFLVFRGMEVQLADAANKNHLAFELRLALEKAWLEHNGVSLGLARMAAARTAAQFVQAEAEYLKGPERARLPDWVPAMAGDVAAPALSLERWFGAQAVEVEKIREVWALLGTAEALMETGGDIRLTRDPKSALNGYGCSHRPRPWAVTFASSTASSSSERGYVAADKARLRMAARLLRGEDRRIAVRAALDGVRQGIASAFGLERGQKVVLAASGTDSELLALALSHLRGRDQPITSILIAPEETGRGVPMAAKGHHFAVDTALGHDVTFEAAIEGFRPDTQLVNVALRGEMGRLRAAAAVEAEIARGVAEGIAQGRLVVLHALDLSKTGLLAPRPAFLAGLRERFGNAFDIVVDACQARLSAGALRRYLALDAVVLMTGSKFFTGPPFAGAAILPAGIAARLGQAALPAGLAAYFGRDDFFAGCRAAVGLPKVGNLGLALRWHAALAEVRALQRVKPARRAEILAGFGAAVRAAVGVCPALSMIEAPAIIRGPEDEDWERLPTIFTFALRAPHAPARCLTPVEARAVYFWLNTDLSGLLPEEPRVAARICHIGQPVPLPQPFGEGLQGALRVSAGARLISGEPSHRGMKARARLRREFEDVAVVFRKIELILQHWRVLWAVNPAPRYRPARLEEAAAFLQKSSAKNV